VKKCDCEDQKKMVVMGKVLEERKRKVVVKGIDVAKEVKISDVEREKEEDEEEEKKGCEVGADGERRFEDG
jgi:hypothetical protein